MRGRVCVCVCTCVRESDLSVVVWGSGEYQAHPWAGLTNSRANTHLAATLKSVGAEPEWTERSLVLTDLPGVHRAGAAD